MSDTPNLDAILDGADDSEDQTDKALAELKLLKNQIDILKQFASDLAEGDCEYGDNCPKGCRHGVCYSCQARKALDQLTKPVA
jgi:hypothetical protein